MGGRHAASGNPIPSFWNEHYFLCRASAIYCTVTVRDGDLSLQHVRMDSVATNATKLRSLLHVHSHFEHFGFRADLDWEAHIRSFDPYPIWVLFRHFGHPDTHFWGDFDWEAYIRSRNPHPLWVILNRRGRHPDIYIGLHTGRLTFFHSTSN